MLVAYLYQGYAIERNDQIVGHEVSVPLYRRENNWLRKFHHVTTSRFCATRHVFNEVCALGQ